MAKSTTSANNTLDWQLGGATPTRPTTRFISMHTGDPGATGASECSGSGYARQSLTFNAASAKAATNASATTNTLSGALGPVTHFGIWDASTGGNFLYGGAVTTAQTFANGDVAAVAIGAITITEA